MKSARTILNLIFGITFFMFCFAAAAQNPPTPPPSPQGKVVTPKTPYDSTKAQLAVTKEENLQLKANASTVSYQQAMKDLGAQYKDQEDYLAGWITQVRKDNGWDDTYAYDRVKDQWTHSPKPEAAKPADPKAEPKK